MKDKGFTLAAIAATLGVPFMIHGRRTIEKPRPTSPELQSADAKIKAVRRARFMELRNKAIDHQLTPREERELSRLQ